ncbi:hypothetical protein [Sphingomonas sp. dw_22]|uniref:hypothetical protein n=1 Tax=Sphingomonas sp. dw_22 TaxID=2721175 RepID=UPI001BD5BBC9|nr:hypothetical protein [Sphingomonas sp. dw_22]
MRVFAAPLLTLALLAAAPAAAQSFGGYNPPPPPRPMRGDSGISGQIGQIGGDIRAGRRSGQLSRSEARALRRERNMIGTLEDRFAQDGLSDSEKAELQTRTEILRADTIARRTGGKK